MIEPNERDVPATGSVIKCTEPNRSYRYRLMMGTPTMGTIRIEWHDAAMGMVMPTNFSLAKCCPLNFHVDDAQNVIVQAAINADCEWVWLLEEDTIRPPPNTCLVFQEWIRKGDFPVISALYRLKGASGEPLIYRGIGTGAFTDWKLGETVWADGVPTGCIVIHTSILKLMYDESPEYEIRANGQLIKLRRVFENPRNFEYDPVSGAYAKLIGTSDLNWCHRVIKENVLERAGWAEVARLKYPFPVDTRIVCGHIERDSGVIW